MFAWVHTYLIHSVKLLTNNWSSFKSPPLFKKMWRNPLIWPKQTEQKPVNTILGKIMVITFCHYWTTLVDISQTLLPSALQNQTYYSVKQPHLIDESLASDHTVLFSYFDFACNLQHEQCVIFGLEMCSWHHKLIRRVFNEVTDQDTWR